MPKVDKPGLRKAAILLVSLDHESAAKVLGLMDRDTVEAVTLEIARLGDFSADEQTGVLEEFYALGVAGASIDRGGVDSTEALPAASSGCANASQATDGVEFSIPAAPFEFLQQKLPQHLLAAMADEHPQTIALVLIHLPPQKAGELLTGLPSAKQVDVVRRIASMDETRADIIREVERALELRLAATANQKFEKPGGVGTVAEILSVADRATERGILANMAQEDPALAEQIRRLMFAFEDLLKLDNSAIRVLLEEVDTSRWALALKGASEELKKKVFSNLSQRGVALFKAEMDDLGPLRVADVEAAQQQVVDVLRGLEDAGEIVISGFGEAA